MTAHKLDLDTVRNYVEKQLFEPGESSQASISSGHVGCVGIELEVFPFKLDNNTRVSIPLYGKKRALIETLLEVCQQFGGVPSYRNPIDAKIENAAQVDKIKFPDGTCFLFEPGGQLEISTKPCTSLSALKANLTSSKKILEKVTEGSGIEFGQHGLNPLADVLDFGNQLTKPRYQLLQSYLEGIGTYGKRMMLQTCSMHINLDLGQDEARRIQRIRAANLLIPFVTALFANSPAIDAKGDFHKAYRSFIWQNLDPARSGIWLQEKPGPDMSKEDLVDAYSDFVIRAPLIYIPELKIGVLPHKYTMDYWMNNAIEDLSPTLTHLENHVSLLFPEVRLKGYLELRSIDAPPMEWELIPVLFYTGLLYSDRHLEKTIALLAPMASDTAALFKKATFGLESDQIFKTAIKLMHLADDGLASLPENFRKKEDLHHFKTFFDRFTKVRKCFADEAFDKFRFS